MCSGKDLLHLQQAAKADSEGVQGGHGVGWGDGGSVEFSTMY